MVSQKLAGWGLVLLAVALLAVGERLSLLAVLLPVSLLAGLGITRSQRKKIGAMDGSRIRLPRVTQ